MSQVFVIRRRQPGAQLAERPKAAATLDGPTRATIVGIAASTGGPPALAAVLGALKRDFPAPILVVQHMGAQFMDGFASWLAGQTPLRVKLSENREIP